MYDQTRPRRDSGTSSNSPPSHPGLRQYVSARGKKTELHAEHRVPSSLKAFPSPVNHPATTGVRVRDKAPPEEGV
ncbi:hypothetical protein GCM10010251_29660 [Streptomyces aurantiogriseus]|uniref:Uncharacterized protein n=1 Tax=Streptomyces aurantiogriseus TaxID=66870 RepID=A0A918F8W9_9ACTN|nr:hypothetical protein GCM10010251_29660 [Streptomyces aurantiogriseus]